MDKLPLWTPLEVKKHAIRLIEIGGLNTSKPLLMRLIAHPDMQKVWKGLSLNTDDPQKLIDFLEFVRLHPTLQGNTVYSITTPSNKVQRKAFKKVSELFLQILQVLTDLSPVDEFDDLNPVKIEREIIFPKQAQKGWGLLEIALKHVELDAATATLQSQLLTIKRIQTNIEELQLKGSIISLLETLHLAASYAASITDSTLPKRRNTERAKRNHLIKDLKRYPKRKSFGLTDTLIAVTVNTAFVPSDGGASADDVRKLKI